MKKTSEAVKELLDMLEDEEDENRRAALQAAIVALVATHESTDYGCYRCPRDSYPDGTNWQPPVWISPPIVWQDRDPYGTYTGGTWRQPQ